MFVEPNWEEGWWVSQKSTQVDREGGLKSRNFGLCCLFPSPTIYGLLNGFPDIWEKEMFNLFGYTSKSFWVLEWDSEWRATFLLW